MHDPRESRYAWRNGLTYVGGSLSLLALLCIVSFLFFDLVSPEPSPYVGLFTFLVFPAVLIAGLVMAIAGILVGRARIRRARADLTGVEYYPRIDLNLESHRRVLMAIGGLTMSGSGTGVGGTSIIGSSAACCVTSGCSVGCESKVSGPGARSDSVSGAAASGAKSIISAGTSAPVMPALGIRTM